jgi:tetratricopeptide (TPR) repeat protein
MSKKLLLTFGVLVVLLGLGLAAQAQNSGPIEPGSFVVINLDVVPTYVQPAADSGLSGDVVTGMISQVVTSEVDASGLIWYYLQDNAYAWVPSEVNGEPTLMVYEDEPDLQQQITEVTQQIQADPSNVMVYLRRGMLYEGLGDTDSAAADLSRAIELDPENGLLYDYRSKVYWEAGAYRLGMADIQQAIGHGRDTAQTYNRWALIYLGSDRVSDALQVMDRAIAIQPEFGLLYSNQGVMLEKMGEYNEAFDAYGQAVALDPYLAMALVNRGLLLANIYGNEDAAFEDFNTAVIYDPYYADGWQNRGVHYMLRGEFDLGLADLEHAISLDPENEYAFFGLGAAYAHFGRTDDAIEAYTEAMDIGDRFDFSARLYRAQLFLAQGDTEAAMDDLDFYINFTGRDAAYFNIVGHMVRAAIYLQEGNYETAYFDYTFAYDVDSSLATSYAYWFSGWRVVFSQEDQIAELEAEIEAKPSIPEPYLECTNLYMQLGEWDAALLFYDQYIRLSGDQDSSLTDFIDYIRETYAK